MNHKETPVISRRPSSCRAGTAKPREQHFVLRLRFAAFAITPPDRAAITDFSALSDVAKNAGGPLLPAVPSPAGLCGKCLAVRFYRRLAVSRCHATRVGPVARVVGIFLKIPSVEILNTRRNVKYPS